MKKNDVNTFKLGLFVIAGLLFLIVLLYMIGKNKSLFGTTYTLKAKFSNIQGLVAGNNVRYLGIQSGTVKKIEILNDSVIVMTMAIDKKMERFIRKTAIVSIGTEGLVGNRVVNIVPSRERGSLAGEGDFLITQQAVTTADMWQTLSNTNNTLTDVATGLKEAIEKLNSSEALWVLLNDKNVPRDLAGSLANLRIATGNASEMSRELYKVVKDINGGKGSIGHLLKDSSFSDNLDQFAVKINHAGEHTDSIVIKINNIVGTIDRALTEGKGTINLLLKDSITAHLIKSSLEDIKSGTEGFSENMEALKHNFLFRSFFRKQEKKNKK